MSRQPTQPRVSSSVGSQDRPKIDFRDRPSLLSDLEALRPQPEDIDREQRFREAVHRLMTRAAGSPPPAGGPPPPIAATAAAAASPELDASSPMTLDDASSMTSFNWSSFNAGGGGGGEELSPRGGSTGGAAPAAASGPAPPDTLEALLASHVSPPKKALAPGAGRRGMRAAADCIRVTVSDPFILSALNCSKPSKSVTVEGVTKTSEVIRRALVMLDDAPVPAGQFSTWLPDADDFILASEEFNFVYDGARECREDAVLLKPKPYTHNRCAIVHASLRVANPPRTATLPFTVTVTHEPQGCVQHRVLLYADMQLHALPDFLCAQLFLRRSGLPKLQESDLEYASFAFVYGCHSVPLVEAGYLRLESGPMSPELWGRPTAYMTVMQLFRRGVKHLQLKTREALSGARNESAGDKSSSFLVSPNMGPIGSGLQIQSGSFTDASITSNSSSGGPSVRRPVMDEQEALVPRNYIVFKRNERRVKQERVFRVDGAAIFNMLPNDQGGTKRPTRRIADISTTVISPADQRRCLVEYARNSNADVANDDLEFTNPQECASFVEQVTVLRRKFQAMESSAALAASVSSGSIAAPSLSGSSSPEGLARSKSALVRFFDRFT